MLHDLRYRLPTTFVRVSGTITTTLDAITSDSLKEVKALATTVVEGDTFTDLRAPLSVDSHSQVERTMKFTPDGRLLSLDPPR